MTRHGADGTIIRANRMQQNNSCALDTVQSGVLSFLMRIRNTAGFSIASSNRNAVSC